MLRNNINLMICEIDVSCNNKNGKYGQDCDNDDICPYVIR